MSGPRHLWSGDWERESARAAEGFKGTADAPAAEEAPAGPPARRVKGNLRLVAVGLAAFLLVVAAALAINGLSGSSSVSHPPRQTPQAVVPAAPGQTPQSGPTQTPQANPQFIPTPAGLLKTVNWLGMQIVTVPSYGTVIETAQPGSGGFQAGLNPGDVIVSINHRAIISVTQIASAIANLSRGDVVEVTVDRGSTEFQTAVTLAAPPTPGP
jgi:membrane-associated protease RseP (regulator of RpoE activity)